MNYCELHRVAVDGCYEYLDESAAAPYLTGWLMILALGLILATFGSSAVDVLRVVKDR